MIKASFRVQFAPDNYYLKATLNMQTWELALARLQQDDPCWAARNSPTVVSVEKTTEPQTPWGTLTVEEEMKDEHGNFITYRKQVIQC